MPETIIPMNVRRLTSQASVIEIHGEITAQSENSLMDAYTQATNGSTKAVILDFNDLEYMNSSGIGLLVTMLIRANRQNRKLMAVGLNEHYQQIFQLTRLDEAIGIYESEAAALAAVR